MPWEALALLLAAIDDVNIYPAPQEQYVADAIVIVPGSPWIAPGGDTWGDAERYRVTVLVPTGGPQDTLERLHVIVHELLDLARRASWEFEEVGEPAIDETTGTPFLTATATLIYRNCEE